MPGIRITGCLIAGLCCAAGVCFSGPEAGDPEIVLRAADLRPLATVAPGSRWWDLSGFQSLLGASAGSNRVLGYEAGPDKAHPEYAFAAVDASRSYSPGTVDVKRFLAILRLGDGNRPDVLIAFDLVTALGGAPSPLWTVLTEQRPSIEGERISFPAPWDPGRCVRLTGIHPGAASKEVVSTAGSGGWRVGLRPKRVRSEFLFLNIAELTPDRERALAVREISEMGLAGVQIADRLVLFHTERYAARSSVFFDATGSGPVKCLVIGLAPGTWEIWRGGFLEDPQGYVEKTSGALYFEGPAGSYYLKKLY